MIAQNPIHQSARSACPVMIVPTNRQCGRAAWKWMWQCSRIIWRDNGKKIENTVVNSMIFGTGSWQTDHSGL